MPGKVEVTNRKPGEQTPCGSLRRQGDTSYSRCAVTKDCKLNGHIVLSVGMIVTGYRNCDFCGCGYAREKYHAGRDNPLLHVSSGAAHVSAV